MTRRGVIGNCCAGVVVVQVVFGLAVHCHSQPVAPPPDWIAAAVEHCRSIPDEAARSRALYELAYVQARAGRLAEAKATALQVVGSSHRIATLAFIARSEYEAGDVDAARATLAEAKRLALARRTDGASFGEWSLIRGLVEFGQTEEAQAFVNALPSKFPPTVELTVLAEQLSKEGKIGDSLSVLRQMDQRFWPNSLGQIAAANSSAEAEATWLGVAEQVRDPGLRDLAYQNLASAFAAQGKFDLAEQVAARIRADATQRRTRGNILSVWAKDRPSDALADRLANESSREEKMALLQPLIKALAAEGRVEEAEQAIEQMATTIRESPRDPETSAFGRFDDAAALATVEANYLWTAGALRERGDHDAAQARIDRAKRAILSLPPESGITKAMLVQMLTAAQVAVGDLTGARVVVQATDPPFRLAAEKVAVAFVEAGNAAAAIEMTALLPREAPGYGRSLGAVAAAMIKAGDVAGARELLSPLGASWDDAEGFRAAGSAMIERDRAAELAEWLSEMRLELHRAYACLGAADVGNKRATPES